MNNPMQTPMHKWMKTSMQKPHILYSTHKRTQNARDGRVRIVGNISVKYNDFSTHKSMVKTTKWSTQLLVDSIDCMQEHTHETSLAFEEKKQRFKDKITNETQMYMVKAITRFIMSWAWYYKVTWVNNVSLQNKIVMNTTKKMHNKVFNIEY